MVIDTSAILALLFGEPQAEWVAGQLAAHRGELQMSTVNLTETLIRVRDRKQAAADDMEAKLLESGVRFVAPTVEQSRIAAEARLKLPLNLGDCFAYALAADCNDALLTLDSDFRATDCDLVSPGL